MDSNFQKGVDMDEMKCEIPWETLERKVIAYYTDIWRDQRHEDYQSWLNNFRDSDRERLNALFLLSKFIYFGNLEIKALLKAVYRDLYKYPIVEQIRINANDTIDDLVIKRAFKQHKNETRFLGVGNPSESGVHLLYYFRQENKLSKEMFVNAHELFKSTYSEDDKKMVQTWADDNINHLVFIDDFCGKGSQAINYIKDVVTQVKLLRPACEVDYFVLVANKKGLKNVKENTDVDRSEAIFELDESFKCFNDHSRYFVNAVDDVDKDFCKDMCKKYGEERSADAKSYLGFDDEELMLSFFHNTPNNTLPIFWTDKKGWYPIFSRSTKIY